MIYYTASTTCTRELNSSSPISEILRRVVRTIEILTQLVKLLFDQDRNLTYLHVMTFKIKKFLQTRKVNHDRDQYIHKLESLVMSIIDFKMRS